MAHNVELALAAKVPRSPADAGPTIRRTDTDSGRRIPRPPRPLARATDSGHILTGLDLVRDGQRAVEWPLKRDPFLLETSVPGIFAAGDVRNGTKHGVAAASGDGKAAVSNFWQYLATV